VLPSVAPVMLYHMGRLAGQSCLSNIPTRAKPFPVQGGSATETSIPRSKSYLMSHERFTTSPGLRWPRLVASPGTAQGDAARIKDYTVIVTPAGPSRSNNAHDPDTFTCRFCPATGEPQVLCEHTLRLRTALPAAPSRTTRPPMIPRMVVTCAPRHCQIKVSTREEGTSECGFKGACAPEQPHVSVQAMNSKVCTMVVMAMYRN
jgi:hypothetical protein